jgi:hypothetical protein
LLGFSMSGERHYLIARRLLVGALLMYLGPTTASALVRGRVPRLTDFTGPGAWERVLSAVALATSIVIFAWFHERRMGKHARAGRIPPREGGRVQVPPGERGPWARGGTNAGVGAGGPGPRR